MDFKLEISRDNATNSYEPVDLFPNQQLEYNVDFYDKIEIDKVRLPFSTDLRIPLTTLNKSVKDLKEMPDPHEKKQNTNHKMIAHRETP
jgi:hypothetical protein